MAASDYLEIIVLAAILGGVGQGVRFLLGSAGPQSGKVTGKSVSTTLGASLLIGAIVGVAAAVWQDVDPDKLSKEFVLSLIGAGYLGTDALDQFVSRVGISNGRELPKVPSHH